MDLDTIFDKSHYKKFRNIDKLLIRCEYKKHCFKTDEWIKNNKHRIIKLIRYWDEKESHWHSSRFYGYHIFYVLKLEDLNIDSWYDCSESVYSIISKYSKFDKKDITKELTGKRRNK